MRKIIFYLIFHGIHFGIFVVGWYVALGSGVALQHGATTDLSVTQVGTSDRRAPRRTQLAQLVRLDLAGRGARPLRRRLPHPLPYVS